MTAFPAPASGALSATPGLPATGHCRSCHRAYSPTASAALVLPKTWHLPPAHGLGQRLVAPGDAVEQGQRILLLHADAAMRIRSAQPAVAATRGAVEGDARAPPARVVKVDVHGVDHAGRGVSAPVAPLALVEREHAGRRGPGELVAAIIAPGGDRPAVGRAPRRRPAPPCASAARPTCASRHAPPMPRAARPTCAGDWGPWWRR